MQDDDRVRVRMEDLEGGQTWLKAVGFIDIFIVCALVIYNAVVGIYFSIDSYDRWDDAMRGEIRTHWNLFFLPMLVTAMLVKSKLVASVSRYESSKATDLGHLEGTTWHLVWIIFHIVVFIVLLFFPTYIDMIPELKTLYWILFGLAIAYWVVRLTLFMWLYKRLYLVIVALTAENPDDRPYDPREEERSWFEKVVPVRALWGGWVQDVFAGGPAGASRWKFYICTILVVFYWINLMVAIWFGLILTLATKDPVPFSVWIAFFSICTIVPIHMLGSWVEMKQNWLEWIPLGALIIATVAHAITIGFLWDWVIGICGFGLCSPIGYRWLDQILIVTSMLQGLFQILLVIAMVIRQIVNQFSNPMDSEKDR